ncbi:hypothetical protein VH569_28000 [Azospirillum sp. 11R-A]|uniref:hypothetical protein n=1 Tax=Azospirillum sp. 11R-A TaxID=3111634 RepID=UPI003C1D7ECE
MHIDLEILEAKARAAKAAWPSAWRVTRDCSVAQVDDDGQGFVWTVSPADEVVSGAGRSGCGMPKAIAEYMAASDPETVLMLIHTIKAWR